MTDKEIARFSAPVIQAYRDMEDELLRLIAKQIARDKRVSDTSAWRIRQLARAGEINQQALAIIDQYAGGISSEIAEAILAAAEGEVGTLDTAMLNLLSEKGKMTDEQRNMLDAFRRQSRQELNIENARIAESYAQALQEDCNLVNTVMGYQTASAYSECVRETAEELDRQAVINELNAGSMSVVSGTESLQEATRRTLERLAVKGIPGFVDKAGREWSPEAYVKMDLRSTMANTARAAQDARCDRYGIQLIEVSSHNGARPKCAPYQGRIFSRNGSRGVTEDLNGGRIEYTPLSQTSYGEPDGLFGINCGHQQYPFIPGVSVKTYYPYPEEQNAERYQQFQQQRAMERKIRADKRKCMMMQETGDDEGLRKAAGKLRADKDRYRDFCKQTGLGAHMENTQVYGYDRSKSMKTVWSERKGEVAKMSASSNDWSRAVPISHTAEEMKAMTEYARQYGVQIYNPRKFDGDLDVLRVQIDTIGKIKEEFGLRQKITISFSEMDDDDFAETVNNSITFNLKALRNREVTIQNLRADHMLSAHDPSGIAAHEMGHIISRKYGEKGLDIAKQSYYNIYNKHLENDEMIIYLKENVSGYCGRGYRYTHKIVFEEITPEIVSMHYSGESSAFSTEFVHLLKEGTNV